MHHRQWIEISRTISKSVSWFAYNMNNTSVQEKTNPPKEINSSFINLLYMLWDEVGVGGV